MMPGAGSAQLSVGSVGGMVGGPRAAIQSTGQACAKTEWGQGLVASGLVWQGLLGWLETDQADIRLWHCEPLRGGIDLVLHRGVVVARHSSLPDGRGVRRGYNQRDASGTQRCAIWDRSDEQNCGCLSYGNKQDASALLPYSYSLSSWWTSSLSNLLVVVRV